jgi:hypothetical protein
MARETSNPFPMDESILAALVEGDLDVREADSVRERLLAADPAWAARIELMERDRVMLRALGDETPPNGLTESVIARLEREALLGLASGEPASGRPPVSIVRPAQHGRDGGFGRWMFSPAGAGLAMAAVLALAVGAALQVIGPRPAPVPPLAPDLASEAEANPAGAIALDRHGPSERAVMGDPAPQPSPEGASDRPAALALEQPQPDRTFSEPERAVALLAEGRLIIRVRAAAPEEATAELGRIAGRQFRPNEAFRLQPEISEPLALAMERHFAPPAIDDAPRVLAADDDRPVAIEPRTVEQPLSSLESIYLADARLDRAALASLLAALSLGDGRVAVFEELAEPLELPRVLTPDAVLWWGRAPSEWSRRAYLPIAIERVEQ